MNGLVPFDTIKAKLSLHDALDRLGLAHRGRSMRCPNWKDHTHGDQTMSASVSLSKRTWHCHACGKGGSVIDLWAVANKLTPAEAGRALAAAYSLGEISDTLRPPPRPTVAQTPSLRPADSSVQDALKEFQHALSWSNHAKQYSEGRGIPLAVAVKAGLEFAKKGSWPNERGDGQPRIVAPVTTPDGTLLTLYGRSTFACAKQLRHDFLSGDKGIFNASASRKRPWW